jgi:hypothetical protein
MISGERAGLGALSLLGVLAALAWALRAANGWLAGGEVRGRSEAR